MAPSDEAGWVQQEFDIPAPSASGAGTFRSAEAVSAGKNMGSGFVSLSDSIAEAHTRFTRFITDLRKAATDPTLRKFTEMMRGLGGVTGLNEVAGAHGRGASVTDISSRISEQSRDMDRRTTERAEGRTSRRQEAKEKQAQAERKPNGGDGGFFGGGRGARMVAAGYAATQVAGRAAPFVNRVESGALDLGRWTNRVQGMGYLNSMPLAQAERRLADTYMNAGGYFSGPGQLSMQDNLALRQALFRVGGGGAYGGGEHFVRQIAGMTAANPSLGIEGAASMMLNGARSNVPTLNRMAQYGIIRNRDDVNDRDTFVSRTLAFAMGGNEITQERVSSMVDPTSRINTNLRNLGLSQDEIVSMAYEAAESRGFRAADSDLEGLEREIAKGATHEAKLAPAAREMMEWSQRLSNTLKGLVSEFDGLYKVVSGLNSAFGQLATVVTAFAIGGGFGKIKDMLGIGAKHAPKSKVGKFAAAALGKGKGLFGKGAGLLSKGAGLAARGVGRVLNLKTWLASSAANAAYNPLEEHGLTLDLGEHLGDDNLLTKATAQVGRFVNWWGLGDNTEDVGDPDGGLYDGGQQDSGTRRAVDLRVEEARDILKSRTHHSASHVRGLKPGFATALAAMFKENPRLRLTSGFRSVQRQAELYAAAVKKYGSEKAARRWVAPPGKSRHNFGLAADIGPKSEYGWLKANAHRFGLHIPLGNEPWHIEPKGSRSGKDMVDMAIYHSAENSKAMDGLGGGSTGLGGFFSTAGWGGDEKSALESFFGGMGGLLSKMGRSDTFGRGGAGTSGLSADAFAGGQRVDGAMSMTDVARIARAAGFTGADVAKAVAVAWAESDGNPNAVGDRDLTIKGEKSVGLWQINYRPGRDEGNPARDPQRNLDPLVNAKNAFAIYQQQGWRAWSTTHDDAGHRHFSRWMQQAKSAQIAAGVGDPPEPVAGGLPSESAGGRMVVNGGSTTKTVNMYVTVKDGDGRKLANEVLRILRDEQSFAAMGGV